MKGRQTIDTNRAFTLDELAQFMGARWEQGTHNEFRLGHPTNPAAPDRYIVLPATDNWCTIVYPKTGGLFKKQPKIVLTSTYTTAGATWLAEHGPPMMRDSLEEGIRQSKKARALNQEMVGEAEEYLLWYTAHLRELLGAAGFLA